METVSPCREQLHCPIRIHWSELLVPHKQTRAVSNAAKRSTYDVAWNFGFGLQLIKKLQLSASYGLGFTKAYKLLDSDAHAANIEGKNRYWTVTARLAILEPYLSMATILNIETSTSVCSVALSAEGMILTHLENFDGRNHATLLSGYIKALPGPLTCPTMTCAWTQSQFP